MGELVGICLSAREAVIDGDSLHGAGGAGTQRYAGGYVREILRLAVQYAYARHREFRVEERARESHRGPPERLIGSGVCRDFSPAHGPGKRPPEYHADQS